MKMVRLLGPKGQAYGRFSLSCRISKNIRMYCFLIASSCSIVLLTSCSTQLLGTFVDYHRTGGFTNFDDRLVTDSNGNIIVTRKTETCEFVLDDDEMNQLRNVFDEAMFSDLDQEYVLENQGRDIIEYVITYEGHTVTTKDSAVPDELWPVLESLNQIVDKCP